MSDQGPTQCGNHCHYMGFEHKGVRVRATYHNMEFKYGIEDALRGHQGGKTRRDVILQVPLGNIL